MAAATVELLDDHNCVLGEGPVWDELTQSLYWVDIVGKKSRTIQLAMNLGLPNVPEIEKRMRNLVMNLNMKTKERKVWATNNDMVGSMALWEGKPQSLLVATATGFQELDTTTGKLTTITYRSALENKPNCRFNDGKCDALGRFWAGTMDYDGGVRYQGSLYCCDTDGSVSLHRRPVSISNGIEWSLDNKTMYYVDSPEKTVIAFDYDLTTGKLSNERVIIRLDTTGIEGACFDGMTIDSDGNLWIAVWEGHCIKRYDPKSGQLLQTIEIPALNVTSCSFGGPNFDTLFVTSADLGTSAKGYPKAGCTFAVKVLGVKGAPLHRFKLNKK